MGNKQRKRKKSRRAIRIRSSRNAMQRYMKKENGEESASSPPPCDPLDIVFGPAGPSQSGLSTPRVQTYQERSAPTFTMPLHTSASILKISDEKTLQLIDLYSNEDCLWNTQSEDYKNKHRRALASEKIAAIMDLPNFKASHVIAKFKNLRDAYSQEVKKMKHSIESGDKVYTPRVYWWDKMDSFLRPHLQPRKESSTDEVQIPGWVELDIGLNPDTKLGLEDSRASKRKYPKRSRTEDTGEKSIAQTLQDIQSNLQVLTSRDDDYTESFGKYVASLLRTLPPQKALALQPQIVSLITAELEEETDPLVPQPERTVPSPERTFDGIELKFEPETD